MHRTRPTRHLCTAALLLVLAGSTALAGPLEGRWVLVEQRYADGAANMAARDEPLRIAFERRGGVLVGKIWSGDDEKLRLEWPAVIAGGERRAVSVERRLFTAQEDAVSARYRVAPSTGDDLVLAITEEYRIADGGSSLVGTVNVAFERQGEARGSYVLHRRFEREP